MENNRPDNISYFDHEAQLVRADQNLRKWFLAWAITFAVLVITNVGWIIYEAQYQDVTTVTQEADSNESPVYLNGTGEMNINGEGTTNGN